jgi:hypothetical protein
MQSKIGRERIKLYILFSQSLQRHEYTIFFFSKLKASAVGAILSTKQNWLAKDVGDNQKTLKDNQQLTQLLFRTIVDHASLFLSNLYTFLHYIYIPLLSSSLHHFLPFPRPQLFGQNPSYIVSLYILYSSSVTIIWLLHNGWFRFSFF